MQACRTCGIEKPFSEFYKNPPHAKGYRRHCKVCLRVRCVEYQSDPDIRARRAAQAKGRPRTQGYDGAVRKRQMYGVTPERYAELLERQDGKCAVCRAPEPSGMGGWHVDHDHSCCPGKRSCGACIRGLLCARCNPMLGMARDDIAVLQAAVDYLSNALLNAIKSPT